MWKCITKEMWRKLKWDFKEALPYIKIVAAAITVTALFFGALYADILVAEAITGVQGMGDDDPTPNVPIVFALVAIELVVLVVSVYAYASYRHAKAMCAARAAGVITVQGAQK